MAAAPEHTADQRTNCRKAKDELWTLCAHSAVPWRYDQASDASHERHAKRREDEGADLGKGNEVRAVLRYSLRSVFYLTCRYLVL